MLPLVIVANLLLCTTYKFNIIISMWIWGKTIYVELNFIHIFSIWKSSKSCTPENKGFTTENQSLNLAIESLFATMAKAVELGTKCWHKYKLTWTLRKAPWQYGISLINIHSIWPCKFCSRNLSKETIRDPIKGLCTYMFISCYL